MSAESRDIKKDQRWTALQSPRQRSIAHPSRPRLANPRGAVMAEHENSIGESDEWYTPPEIFHALGERFDLDPCSPGAGHWVPADKFYTKLHDGLKQPWDGFVFVNPPFGGTERACAVVKTVS